ncbi:MAG: hypothetical protein MUQ26_06590, partial [Armatimonadetes bacterium]|nr:hypothetical protein [Armatimonadota bacterium]
GERLHIYLPQQNTVFLNVSDQPFGTPFTGFKAQALLGGEAPDAEITVQRARYQGRSVDRFERTHEGLDEKLVIFADRHTALPLAVEVYGRLSGDWQLLSGTETVEYNITLDPDLFVLSPPAGAVVVDKQAWAAAWQTRYDEGMARAVINGEEAVLRDFQVTTLGDVHAIWSPGRPVGVPGPYPKLTDSLGTLYLRVQEGFQAGDDPCAWFVPLLPLNTAPTWYELTVETGPRDEPHVTFRVEQPILSPGPDPIYPVPDHTQGAVAFFWQDGPTAEVTRAQARATYWQKHGDPHQALHYFEEMIRTADRDLRPTYLAPTTWLEIGSLYEQVRRSDQARHAYRRGIDAYRGEDWYQGTAEELRTRLERLR